MFVWSRHQSIQVKSHIAPRSQLVAALILLCFCLISPSRAGQAHNPLPLLGDPVSAIVSPTDEITLGHAYLRALRSQMPMITDPTLNHYLNGLTTRIISASQHEIPPIQMTMINSSAINAFAVPGGILGMNAGLFIYTTTEAELSAIIAHELAHLSQRHYARGVEHRQQTRWATYTGLLASLAMMVASDSNAGIAGILATQAATIDAHLQFSRQNEREADRIGMDSLHNAGFDPRAMPDFFERLLQSQQFSNSQDHEFLNTHPVTRSRIADSQARADQLTNIAPTVKSSLMFAFMQARINAAYSQTPQDAVAKFRNKLRKKRTNKVYRYGLARAYLRNQQLNKALNTILNQGKLASPDQSKFASELIDDTNTKLQFGLVEIEILLEQEQFDRALQKIHQLQNSYPSHAPLGYYLALATLGLGDNETAGRTLETLLSTDPENILFLEKLLLAHRNLQNQTASFMTQAQLSFAKGRYRQARQQYQQALENTQQENLPLQAKITHKIEDIQKLELKLLQFSR